MEKPIIYACSDSLGETAERVARAAASQYDKQEFNIIRVPYIRSEQQIEELVMQGRSSQCHDLLHIISPTLRRKLRENFDGRIVRKDLTKKIKEGANVPVYVLEFLLGQYCSSDDEEIIEQGVQNVKHILADNFVRPDEAQKVLSQLRRNGSHTIIDMVTVHLDIKKDCFFAEFSNLGLSNVPITDDYPEKF